MNAEEMAQLIGKLRDIHHKDFEKWYDTANLVDVKDYCEIGWLFSRCGVIVESL